MFRRRKGEVDPAEDEATEEERTGPRADGPWDVSELDIPEDDESRLDARVQ